MSLLSLVVAALISEAVWETLKMTWQEGKLSVDRIGALTVGIVFAFITRLDMLELLEMKTAVPYAGIVLSGILISRGANFMHDLINTINNLHITTKQNVADMQRKQDALEQRQGQQSTIQEKQQSASTEQSSPQDMGDKSRFESDLEKQEEQQKLQSSESGQKE